MKKTGSPSGNHFLLILTAAALAAGGFIMLSGTDLVHHVFSGTQPESAAVFGGWTFDQADQRQAAAALAKAGLDQYRWEDDCLLVPAARRGEYERVLSENQALPQKPSDLKENALAEISTFESESRTKLRNLYSSARQLEKTLESFRQIESASVGTSARREEAGLYPKTVVTASISVKPKEDAVMTPELISSITMAARHHLGIADNDNISVIDTVSGRSWLGSEGSVARLSNTTYAAEKARLEEFWSAKFRDAFGYIPNLRVTTSVELEDAVPEAGAGPAQTGLEMKHPIGLEFSDESARPATPDSEPRYLLRAVAVSIAVPESYIRRLAGQESGPFTEDSDLFRAKKEEVLSQLRETAETVLSPAGENEEGTARKVGISLYSDMSDCERVCRPVPEFDLAGSDPALEPGGEAEEAGQPAADPESQNVTNWQSVLQSLTDPAGAGYLLAVFAFAAGIGIRSLCGGRRASKEQESHPAETAETPRGEYAAESGEVRMPASDSLAAGLAGVTQAGPEKARPVPAPFAPAAEAREEAGQKRFDDTRLRQALAELEEEDEAEIGFDGDFDPDSPEETIAPSGVSGTFDSYFTAENREGELRDYRIDGDGPRSAGPHFPVSGPERTAGGEADPHRAAERESRGRPAGEERFSFLAELNDEQLHNLLTKQRPQTIALIARLASEENRGRVLESVGARLRTEVERRMKQGEDPDSKVVAAVEASLLESAGMSGGTAV
ncbi:MAG: hypothetical protein IJG60_05020 [Thermoguttaceae bacterium]|nr:hypothetical protein [Thermoguttaceae bacterium]